MFFRLEDRHINRQTKRTKRTERHSDIKQTDIKKDRERKNQQADYKPIDVKKDTDTDTDTTHKQTDKHTKRINSFDFAEKNTIKANFWGVVPFPGFKTLTKKKNITQIGFKLFLT